MRSLDLCLCGGGWSVLQVHVCVWKGGGGISSVLELYVCVRELYVCVIV